MRVPTPPGTKKGPSPPKPRGKGAASRAESPYPEEPEPADNRRPTVLEVVSERLGAVKGRAKTPAALYELVLQTSAMMADRLPTFAAAVVSEASNIMLALMDEPSRLFAIELLLPWARKLSVKVEEARSFEQLSTRKLAELGYCLAIPDECLRRVFDYTLQTSSSGLPAMVSKFWRDLSLAMPAGEFQPVPPNISPLARWVTAQAKRYSSERDQQTCRSLALFVKGMAMRSGAEQEAEALATSRGEVSKRAAAIATMYAASRQQRGAPPLPSSVLRGVAVHGAPAPAPAPSEPRKPDAALPGTPPRGARHGQARSALGDAAEPAASPQAKLSPSKAVEVAQLEAEAAELEALEAEAEEFERRGLAMKIRQSRAKGGRGGSPRAEPAPSAEPDGEGQQPARSTDVIKSQSHDPMRLPRLPIDEIGRAAEAAAEHRPLKKR